MFDDKENLIGLLFLLVCGVVAGVVVWQIVTGERLRYDGPTWLIWVLSALFFGAIIYGLYQSFAGRRQSGGGPQWPNPASGRRSWWDRLRGR